MGCSLDMRWGERNYFTNKRTSAAMGFLMMSSKAGSDPERCQANGLPLEVPVLSAVEGSEAEPLELDRVRGQKATPPRDCQEGKNREFRENRESRECRRNRENRAR